MGDGTESTDVATSPGQYAELRIRQDGKLVFEHDGEAVIVGRYEHSSSGGLLTLNLGWMREAGLHITLLADPERERPRNGIVLER